MLYPLRCCVCALLAVSSAAAARPTAALLLGSSLPSLGEGQRVGLEAERRSSVESTTHTLELDEGAWGCRGNQCSVAVTLSFPSEAPLPPPNYDIVRLAAAARRPAVLILSGFLQSSAFYSDYAVAVASRGAVVVQYDTKATTVPPLVELGLIQSVLEWAAGRDIEGLGPELSQLQVMGHSRGGMLAALMLTDVWESLISSAGHRPFHAKRTLLLDPVDSEHGTQPNAAEALAGLNRTAGILAGSVTGRCNPSDRNYVSFSQQLSTASPLLVLDAGHMQFLHAGPARMAAYRLLCGAGSLDNSKVLATAIQEVVSFLSHGTLDPPNNVGQ